MSGGWRRLRFEGPREAEFLVSFERLGRTSRGYLWIALLAAMLFVVVFHGAFLKLPPEVMPLAQLAIMAVMVPAAMRGLSSGWSPLHRWSTQLFIGAALIDIACMMGLRVACLHRGYEVVPLIIPIAVLMSLVVAQIRFSLLAPTVLLALAGIVGTELRAFEPQSNRLFQLAAAGVMVLVGLSPAYWLERWARLSWWREQLLNEQACTDSLTGVANRHHFDFLLRQAIRMAARERKSVALAVLDVDHFKSYNDHYGHPAGDECLKAVGSFLGAAMRRPNDFAGRLGGEEFAAVWFDANPENVVQMAEQLRRGLSALGIAAAPGRGAAITASAGLVQMIAPQREDAADAIAAGLLRRADAALYEAKRGGRDRLAVSEPLSEPFSPAQAAAGNTAGRVEAQGGPAAEWRPGPLIARPAQAQKLRFDKPLETQFRASFDQQGRGARALILTGLLIVIAAILLFQHSLLRIPDDADRMGRLTLLLGLTPATLTALLGSLWKPLHRWSAALYIAAIYVILGAQMAERVIQLPKGYDVVPLMMPVAILLSLTVVQIRFRLLVPAAVLAIAGVAGAELWAFELTTDRLLEVGFAILMVLVTLNFSYTLEHWTRIGWLRKRLLNERACTDGLTGLANRRHFDDALRQAIRMAARERKNVALMILDIDHFKSYNDHYGHPAGDECLQAIAGYLGAAMRRPNDFAGRLGGEEFAAVWFDAGPASAPQLAGQLLRGIPALGIAPAPGCGTAVTASAGFVQAIGLPAEAAVERIAVDMLRRADAALYEAKRAGRDRLVVGAGIGEAAA